MGPQMLLLPSQGSRRLGEQTVICKHPEDPNTALCYWGGGGALRAPLCLTVGGIAGLPGGGKAVAEAWIMGWSVQVKGKVGSLLFFPGLSWGVCCSFREH